MLFLQCEHKNIKGYYIFDILAEIFGIARVL